MTLTENMLALARRYFIFKLFPSQQTVTDEAVLIWIAALEECLHQLDLGTESDLGPDDTPENCRILSRYAVQSLAEAAPWLAVQTKTEIARFTMSCQAQLQRGPYQIRFDCFSSRIANWREDLARFVGVPHLKFLEIGSMEGYSACWLIDNILTGQDARIECIDIFEDDRELFFEMNVARSRNPRNVIKHKGKSQDVLFTFPEDHFDFIYVDGSHRPEDVLVDAVQSWRVLRPGGILVFDDYLMLDNHLSVILSASERPRAAINTFLASIESQYSVIRSGYQMTIRKNSLAT
ncbi:class I SAM-dependent methyltransferase [Paludibaculum fermentans]|uniref:class I SAM-dependent methyltransferase n=1 Tax=Paludibaculum fermentans TaxID=1473598 RepID=UPI003EB7868A